jgi:hypothetical protein
MVRTEDLEAGMDGVPWALVISSAGGVATTLIGVVAGGLLGRRTQTRH